MTRYHSVDSNRPPMLFALSLVTLLVACGDGGPIDAALQAQNASGEATGAPQLAAANAELGTPPSEIRPSISAAQLLNDNTLTVSLAQAAVVGEYQPAIAPVEEVADGEATVPTPSESTPIEQPTTEQTPVAVVTPTPTLAVETDTVTTPEPVTTPIAVIEPEPTTTPEPVATLEPTTDTAEPDQGAALPEETTTVQTRFTGSNTPSFVGELQTDQSVQLTWDVDPTARGYNVYRDAEYIATVFEASYLDDFDAFDQNYYYEIQAFDPNENYSTIATGLTVVVTGTGRTDPNAPQVDEDLLNNYELVFSDEFNGTSLDTSKWNTAYLWGDDLVINNELQHYIDIANDPSFGFNPFTLDGEALIINTIRTPPELLEKANGQEYLSGVITSYDAFKFTYGYVEARAQVPVGKGYWPAFWLLNAYYDADKPEIDIMEFIGDNQDTAYHTYHYYDEEGNLRSTKSEPTFPIDYSAGFHTFGAEWQPGQVTFYVDRIARHTIVDPKMSQEQMYIIANTAVGGWWPGDPDETTKFPGEYKIDYIRAYQLVGVQQDAPQFENPNSLVPVREEGSTSSPSHLPPYQLWPEGYPSR